MKVCNSKIILAMHNDQRCSILYFTKGDYGHNPDKTINHKMESKGL
jgi:hypothetical protein